MKFTHSFILLSICLIGTLLNSSVHAQTKLVVIPLFGDDAKTLQNVVTVAKSNGDFTTPFAAVNSITDASATNPYLIVIAPGIYNLSNQLIMKDYVSISGSGKQATFLRGSISSTFGAASALIVGADNTELSDITIENRNGTAPSQKGIHIDAGTMTVYRSNISVTGSNSSFTYGISIRETSGFQIVDSEINNTSTASSNRKGVDAFFNFGTIVIDNTTINAGFEGTSIRNESSTIRAHGNQLFGNIDNLGDVLSANTYISDSILSGSIANNNTGLGNTAQVLCDFVFTPNGSSLDENCE